ncbi:hypothetical protein Pint_33120 [Pistacia integerrima]|uniref:Uncharacterized protein n=1 Tax=Pistacia integerrima TaxID=434235 RepID=A0ACC0X7M3_9ROSI|nr:hypothetical protein Pint_33120 [Pistacia integerrima]
MVTRCLKTRLQNPKHKGIL